MNAVADQGFERILPFLLAVLLIFILPMALSRYGLSMSEALKLFFFRFGCKKNDADVLRGAARDRARTPHLKNGGANELTELLSLLLAFVRRQKLMLVYPGTVSHEGKLSTLLAFVVTRAEVVGINCFGYSGTVREKDGAWTQELNGALKEIESPSALSAAQKKLVSSAMKKNGLNGIPFRVVSVFTNRNVTLLTRESDGAYTTEGILAELKELAQTETPQFSPEDVAKKLNALVVRQKTNGQSRKDKKRA